MSYTTTITFPEQNISPTETIQLILVFDTDLTGSNRSWNAVDYNLRVLNYGKREASYDLEDAFMVPGKTSMIIGDPDRVLDDLLFGAGAIAIATDKQAKVTKKVNGVAEFIGNMIEDTIDFDDGTMTLKFTAAPKIDIINKRMVYDEDNNALNPFSYTGSSYYRITAVLEDIFGLVNPSISYSGGSLEVIHDWEFHGKRDTAACFLMDIEFDEIFQMIDPLFFDSSYGLRNCGDILKKYALDWGCFCGFISYDKAFFKKLFYYNASNLQTVNVFNRKKGYRYGLIDYVKVTTGISGPNEPYEQGTFTELEDRYLSRKSLPGFFLNAGISSGSNIKAVISRTNHFVFDHGSSIVGTEEGTIYSNNGSQFTVVGRPYADGSVEFTLPTIKSNGTNNPDAAGTLTLVSGVGPATITYTAYGDADGTYTVHGARQTEIYAGHIDLGDLQSQFWYRFRGNIQNCRVDKFTLRGIGYDFLKDFNYDGSKYQPIQMEWNDAEGTTECEAIYLGEL